MMDIKVDLFQWFMHFIKKSVLVVPLHGVYKSVIKSKIILNQKLAKELHETIIRKVEKRKVYSSFEDNIWGANFANMKLLRKCNKGS